MEMSHFPIAPNQGLPTWPPTLGASPSSKARRCASSEKHPRSGPSASALPQARPQPALRRPAPNPSAAHVTSAACDDLIPGVG